MWGSLGGVAIVTAIGKEGRDRVWVTKGRRQIIGQLKMPAGYINKRGPAGP